MPFTVLCHTWSFSLHLHTDSFHTPHYAEEVSTSEQGEIFLAPAAVDQFGELALVLIHLAGASNVIVNQRKGNGANPL